MKTQLKVTVNDEDVLWGLEKFMGILKREFPGTITWGEMSTTKKVEKAASSIVKAVAAHKKRRESP